MKIGYYCPELGESIEETHYVETCVRTALEEFELEGYAETCAEHEYYQCDGWEWMTEEDGSDIALVIDDKEVGVFHVDLYFSTTFSAKRKEKCDTKINLN